MVSAFLVAAAPAAVPAAEARRLVAAGLAQEKAGDLAAAAESYRAALRAAPRFAEAHDRLGFVLGQQGRTEEAIAEFRRAMEPTRSSSTPSTTSARRSGGRATGRRVAPLTAAVVAPAGRSRSPLLPGPGAPTAGRIDEAIASCARVAGAPPSPRLTCISASRSRSRATAGALAALRGGGARARDNDARNRLGLALMQRGGRGAVARSASSCASSPSARDGAQNLGSALMQKGDLDGAIARLPRARRRDRGRPRAPQPRHGPQAEGRLPEAEAELRRAAALDPTLPDPVYTLAVVLWQTNRPAEAAAPAAPRSRASRTTPRPTTCSAPCCASWARRTRRSPSSARRSATSRPRPRPT